MLYIRKSSVRLFWDTRYKNLKVVQTVDNLKCLSNIAVKILSLLKGIDGPFDEHDVTCDVKSVCDPFYSRYLYIIYTR